MGIRLVFDTDIGTDVDDCLALAVILGSPEFELIGVTCVYGDVELRARMVAKLLGLAGRTGIPIMTGASQPLLGIKPVYWAGHEGVGLLEPGDRAPIAGEHAVDYLVRVVRESPGQIHLLAVGPLTNVALAMRRDPSFARNLAHLTIMGGAVRGDRLDLPLAEHNIACDPEAAHIVFGGGAPMTVVPLDVTTRVAIRAAGVEQLRSTGGAFQTAVADQVARYPRFAQTGATSLHDPLAVAAIVQPDLLTTTDLRLEVETQGRLTTAMTLARRATADAPANAAVALEVDVAAAESFIVDRIVTAPTT